MAATRPQPQGPAIPPAAVVVIAVAAAAAAVVFGYPGLILIPVGLAVGGYMAAPVQLTGKKDANGYPTPINDGEASAMNKYRLWSELKWKAVTPNADWLPGWPVRTIPLVAIGLGAAASALPVADSLPLWVRAVNSLGVLAAINQANASIRRWTAPDDPCPGVDHKYVLAQFKADRTRSFAVVAGAAIALVAAFLSTIVGIHLSDAGPLIAPVSPWVPAAGLGVAAAAAVLTIAHRDGALAKWRAMVRTRAEWTPRWQTLKLDPPPRLVDVTTTGSAEVATFDAAPSTGAAAMLQMSAKITPTLGGGIRAAMLDTPDLDSQGQPVPGTLHPLRFRVALWPADQLADPSDPQTGKDEVELLMASAVSWVADSTGIGRPILVEARPLFDQAPDPDAGTAEGTAAWALTWSMPFGPGWDTGAFALSALSGDIADQAGTQVISDRRAQVMYIGSLLDGTTRFTDPGVEPSLKNLMVENQWDVWWAAILKQGANPPRAEHAVYSEQRLATGEVLKYQPFVVRVGDDPLEFFKLERRIASTLNSAGFVAVTGFPGVGDRPGERHPNGFAVIWTDTLVSVPSSPDRLAPAPGQAPKWVLSGRINEAFDAARLARPEIASALCLTSRRSPKHMWKISLRLHGGVTLSMVRKALQRMKESLGSEYVRVEAAPDGCVIVIGANPAGLVFQNPGEAKRMLASLDWEQAFIDSNVINSAGAVPSLTGFDVMPNNELVQILDFQMPPGIDRGTIRDAGGKLQNATNNAFIDVRPGVGGASTFRLLVAEQNPMPSMVSVDWQAALESRGTLPFATRVDGSPVAFDPKQVAHLLVAGASGGGKSVCLQVLLFSALTQGNELYIVDPTKGGADFVFARPYARGFASTVEEAAACMKHIYAEVVRRKALNVEHGVGSYRDLPEEVRPNHIYLLMDEFTSLMQPDPVARTASDDPEVEMERQAQLALNNLKAYIGTMTGKIAREARSAGITLILATQKLTAKMLDSVPGGSDLKTNLGRALLGNATSGDRMSALKNPFDAPPLGDSVPRGRGLYEGDGVAELVQVWFEPDQGEFARRLAEARDPLPEGEILRFDEIAASSADGSRPGGAAVAESRAVSDPFADFDGEQEVELLDDLDLDLDDLELEDAGAAEEAEGQPAAPDPVPDDYDAPGLPHDLEATADPEPAIHVADAPEIGDRVVLLDVDGTVSPIGGTLDQWEDAALTDSPHGKAWHSPAMLRAIHDLGVPVVWATDWGGDAEEVFAPIAGVRAAGTLTRPPAADGWWKLDALSGWLDEHPHVRAVAWVDDRLNEEDEIGVLHADIAQEIAEDHGVRIHLVTPDSRDGLSPGDIDGIRAFLDGPGTERRSASAEAAPPEPAPEPVAEPVVAALTPQSDRMTIVPLAQNPNIDDDDPFA